MTILFVPESNAARPISSPEGDRTAKPGAEPASITSGSSTAIVSPRLVPFGTAQVKLSRTESHCPQAVASGVTCLIP